MWQWRLLFQFFRSRAVPPTSELDSTFLFILHSGLEVFWERICVNETARYCKLECCLSCGQAGYGRTLHVFVAGLLAMVSSWPRHRGKSWGMSGFVHYFTGSFVMSPLTQFLEQPNGEAIIQCIISTAPVCHGSIIFNTMASYAATWNIANGLSLCIKLCPRA